VVGVKINFHHARLPFHGNDLQKTPHGKAEQRPALEFVPAPGIRCGLILQTFIVDNQFEIFFHVSPLRFH